MNRSYLTADDLTADEQLSLVDLADQLKTERAAGKPRDDLLGRTVALIFEKPSTRTRVSFQVAITELGGQPLALAAHELQLGRGETVADTAQVLSRFCHGIVVRTFGHERVTELAAHASVPVINALTDLEHPCQALADLQTLREATGDLTGRTLAYVGDGNNVANSLLIACAKAGVNVSVGHPAGYEPDAAIVARAQDLASESGSRVLITTDPFAAVQGADAVYADVWTSMGQEAENEKRLADFQGYQITAELMDQAADDAIFLHCLPAHRGEEVTAEVIDGGRSRVFDQAENRLHAQKALLLTLMGDASR